MLIEKLRASKEWLILAVLALIAVLIWCRALGTKSGELAAVFLDVGQGDCTFIRTPSGHTILIDGGGRPDDPDGERMGLSVIEPFLRRQGVNRIDLVVLTHPHDDHVQGLVPVVRDFRVGMVLDPGVPHGAKSYQQFLSTIESRRLPYRRAVRGQVVDFGDGVRMEVLSPSSDADLASLDDANDGSAVVKVVYEHSSILLAGDAGSNVESEIIESGMNARADVLKVGHHGSRYSTSEGWLKAVRPQYAVISVGKGNTFGHPSVGVLERLAADRVRVLRTDERGAVTAMLATDGIRVRTFVLGSSD